MTDRLYYTDARCFRFDARVTAIAEDGRRVYLDRTAFYPTSGGQPHDTGRLGDADVVDVVDEVDRIAHVLAKPIAAGPGDLLHGTIDAARRRDHMQQHTGQHLLSAIFAEQLGAETASVHFGAMSSSLELQVDALPPAALEAAERRANEIVAEARPVTVAFEDAATASGLRKLPTRTGALRIVSIAALDRSACGGTHVATTAEIGPVLLRGVERIRQRVRVEFLCGDRALRRVRADHGLLAAMAQRLSAAIDDVPAIVAGQHERIRTLEAERRALAEQLALAHARELHGASAPGTDGIRRVVERLETGAAEILRGTATAMATLPSVLYVGVVEDPPLIAFAASGDSGIDAGRTLQQALRLAGGRGGGSPRVAQGSVPDGSGVEAIITALLYQARTQ